MELIKISEKDGKKAVSARELYSFLEVKTDFTTWCKRMVDYGFIEGLDYSFIKFGEPERQDVNNPNPKQDCVLSIECAKHWAMMQRTDKGMQARTYFIECEKQLQLQMPNFNNPAEAARAWALEYEQKQLALQKVDNLSTALDSLLDWASIIKISQHNGVKETSFSWRKLKAKSVELGYVIKKAESPRFGYQNLYHINVFKICYPEFNYDIKNEDY